MATQTMVKAWTGNIRGQLQSSATLAQQLITYDATHPGWDPPFFAGTDLAMWNQVLAWCNTKLAQQKGV